MVRALSEVMPSALARMPLVAASKLAPTAARLVPACAPMSRIWVPTVVETASVVSFAVLSKAVLTPAAAAV